MGSAQPDLAGRRLLLCKPCEVIYNSR